VYRECTEKCVEEWRDDVVSELRALFTQHNQLIHSHIGLQLLKETLSFEFFVFVTAVDTLFSLIVNDISLQFMRADNRQNKEC